MRKALNFQLIIIYLILIYFKNITSYIVYIDISGYIISCVWIYCISERTNIEICFHGMSWGLREGKSQIFVVKNHFEMGLVGLINFDTYKCANLMDCFNLFAFAVVLEG